VGVLSQIPFGNKYSKLTVLEEVQHLNHPNGKMKRMVKVLCECGNTVEKAWQDVRGLQQKSCGLCPRESTLKNDYTGMTFGRLTATESHRTSEGLRWNCDCLCGNKVLVRPAQLSNKSIYNCGSCGTHYGTYYWGQVFKNKEGSSVELLGIDRNVVLLRDIESRNNFETHYSNFADGGYSNPFFRSVAGVGYFGVGKFIAKEKGAERHVKEYENWNSMIKRCYVPAQNLNSYQDKEVCDEWKCFQNFAAWAVEQVGFKEKTWHLEKDLLIKGNTVYRPEACCYLPREINGFVKRKRMNDLPIGVDIAYKYDGTPYFRTQAREDGKNVCLGSFSSIEDAFAAYKTHKEGLAKKLAEKYKNIIDRRAYQALLKYEVEITD